MSWFFVPSGVYMVPFHQACNILGREKKTANSNFSFTFHFLSHKINTEAWVSYSLFIHSCIARHYVKGKFWKQCFFFPLVFFCLKELCCLCWNDLEFCQSLQDKHISVWQWIPRQKKKTLQTLSSESYL